MVLPQLKISTVESDLNQFFLPFHLGASGHTSILNPRCRETIDDDQIGGNAATLAVTRVIHLVYLREAKWFICIALWHSNTCLLMTIMLVVKIVNLFF